MSRLLALSLALGLASEPAPAAPGRAPADERAAAPELFESGVEAYRRGDHRAAERLWLAALDAPLPRAERARVLYDLGNAAYREGRLLSAVARYTAATRLAPRHADAWANLELARAEAGLPPADPGDLRGTVRRLATLLTPEESAWAVLAAAGLLLLALLGEALRGGAAWRAASAASAGLVALALVPWALSLGGPGDPVMVVAEGGAELASEPRDDLPRIALVEPAEELRRIDELGPWVRVERRDGTRGWLPASAVEPLRLAPAREIEG